MRNVRAAVLAGAAALLVAGTALAANKDTRMLNIALPDGSVAHVEYVGDVAPRVAAEPLQQFTRIQLLDPFDVAPFAMLDQVSAMMDQQVEALTGQVRAPETQPFADNGKPALDALPNRTASYSFVSIDGNRSCTRSWQVTLSDKAEAPKVIATSSGDCADANGRAVPAEHVPSTPGAGTGSGVTAANPKTIV